MTGALLLPQEHRENTMQLTRNSVETGHGPSDWFTGTVYVDTVAAPSGSSRISASSVHFTPGARTAWHTHPNGQTIWVTEGIGLAQRRGGPIEVIRPGDRVFFEPGVGDVLDANVAGAVHQSCAHDSGLQRGCRCVLIVGDMVTQTAGLPSSSTSSIARWVMKRFAVAPCQ